MDGPSLRELENEVEAARSKLAQDLSTLRAPDTYSQVTDALKEEALDAKDALIDKAKTSLQSTVESWVQDLKAKAAANPTAALAIGAGIAWRLIQRPPIATALIGAGLFTLLRTNASGVAGRSNSDYLAEATARLGEQASDFGAEVQNQAGRAVEAAADHVGEWAGDRKERAEDALRVAARGVAEGTEAAKEQVQEWASRAAAPIRRKAAHTTKQPAAVAGQTYETAGSEDPIVRRENKGRIAAQIETLSTSVEESVGNRETRDALLLGAAGLAVFAALGVAWQKKPSETVSD
jgi:hypothetical protein